ncbi:MAG TPA: folylpolyglutamate synthase/dihydrofolate synthase family protein [Smithella sp.]|nr:folylpolyglutamate synthase/dihydrofolate synthase family protein [Smithella sp.]
MRFSPEAYLESLNIHRMHLGLASIKKLLGRLENPHKAYPVIIIAGTNGKGSTAAMTASILRSAGYNVGLYTSPHLVDVRERIVVNGQKIPRGEFHRIIACVKERVQQPVTYFEFLTAVAFVYFQKRKVDLAVLEVGLGGRLDATNVCRPLVSIITNIDRDHTDYLGGTLEAIAREKAGIIKTRGTCVTAERSRKVLDVFESVCRRRKAELFRVGRDIKIRREPRGLFYYRGLDRNLRGLAVPLRGDHQLSNAALALAAAEICERKGFVIGDEAMGKGLGEVRWEGRLEILRDRPLFILDGAHNPAGIGALCRSLKKDFSYHRLIFIFGALADKDYRRMLKKIISLSTKIILTPIQTTRAVPFGELLQTARGMMRDKPICAKDAANAIALSMTLAKKNDLICAAGSFYLAGEIKQAFDKLAFCDNEKTKKCSLQKGKAR